MRGWRNDPRSPAGRLKIGVSPEFFGRMSERVRRSMRGQMPWALPACLTDSESAASGRSRVSGSEGQSGEGARESRRRVAQTQHIPCILGPGRSLFTG